MATFVFAMIGLGLVAAYLHYKKEPPPEKPLTAQESFERRWQTSDRGNPTLVLDGQRLTVFQQDGGWKWVIADEDDQDDLPLFSDERYKSKGAAQAAGMEELLDLVGG